MTDGGKVQLAAGVTTDIVGKADMAMAGGTDATHLDAALKSVQAWVAERA